jgi:hypothetical protein
VARLTAAGQLVWARRLSKVGVRSVAPIPGGGILLGGAGALTQADSDLAVVVLEDDGDLVWVKTYGAAAGSDDRNGLAVPLPGGMVLGGGTGTTGRAFFLTLDASGSVPGCTLPEIGVVPPADTVVSTPLAVTVGAGGLEVASSTSPTATDDDAFSAPLTANAPACGD